MTTALLTCNKLYTDPSNYCGTVDHNHLAKESFIYNSESLQAVDHDEKKNHWRHTYVLSHN